MTLGMSATRPRRRVIVDTDAKNEADDQYAIVHALLSPSLDIRGVIAAHFGQRPGRSQQSMADSRAEIDLLLEYLGMQDSVRVANGAAHALPTYQIPVPSAGAELIIEEAMRTDADGPLYVAFFGPLTNMAAALLMEPRIAERDVVVVWIGGADYDGRDPVPDKPEFNLSNDMIAANIVFRSSLTVWQVPRSTYAMTAVSYAELEEKVAPCGPLGKYLYDQLVEWSKKSSGVESEYHRLGDSPAVGIILNPAAGQFSYRPGLGFRYDGSYDFTTEYRPIRVYHNIDSRFLFEDFFAKLRRFARDQGAR
ncbi:nucleoside hydrolase [Micromonospora sp. LOL_023]|uniref:nucleoside hydrolase n=1 Tax=Micromonospora sp. LOL_023 TaxID=3345418 RepID=UPI003A878119